MLLGPLEPSRFYPGVGGGGVRDSDAIRRVVASDIVRGGLKYPERIEMVVAPAVLKGYID